MLYPVRADRADANGSSEGVVINKRVITSLAAAAGLLLCASSAFALTNASVFDLRTPGATAVVNGALFEQDTSEPTGTGYINPFLRLQDAPIEEAFNTDYRSGGQAPLDAKSDPNYTHSLQLSDLATVTKGGTDYYCFTLDIDEPNSGPNRYLSLDELRLYVADSGSIGSLADLTSQGTLKWNLDGGGNSTIYLDGGNLSSGNGQDDMRLYVPTSAFAGVDPSRYLYLYSKFGATSGMQADVFDANASFEEWSALTTAPPAAEPGMLSLFGAGLLGLVATRYRRKR